MEGYVRRNPLEDGLPQGSAHALCDLFPVRPVGDDLGDEGVVGCGHLGAHLQGRIYTNPQTRREP